MGKNEKKRKKQKHAQQIMNNRPSPIAMKIVLTLRLCTYGQSEQQRLMTNHCDCEIDHKIELRFALLGQLCVELLKIWEISQEGLEGNFVLALLFAKENQTRMENHNLNATKARGNR